MSSVSKLFFIENQMDCKRRTKSNGVEEPEEAITGMRHECGVFGALACGEWPSQVNYYRRLQQH